MPSDQVFEWKAEYDAILENIAANDVVDTDWSTLRDVIKHKINQNIAAYIADKPPGPPPAYEEQALPNGALKLPPFPDRKQARPPNLPIPLNYMTEKQAEEQKSMIFEQLDEFDSNPPFTIQRVAELCLQPRKHYASVGKYLRAVEKSVLVTSSLSSFPPLANVDTDPTGRSVFSLGSTKQSAPSTPLFSPIPFLHEDARRSKSRSPPPSPLTLAATATTAVNPIGNEPADIKALGLVDELDDPSPGHMSDHPVALSSVTTTGEEVQGGSSAAADEKSPKPGFMPTLQQRFVPAEAKAGVKAEEKQAEAESEEEVKSEDEKMAVDEDKENAKS